MLHQRKCREMIILVTNRKISINHKLVVSKLILWVQMLQRASIRSLLVKSKFKGRVFSWKSPRNHKILRKLFSDLNRKRSIFQQLYHKPSRKKVAAEPQLLSFQPQTCLSLHLPMYKNFQKNSNMFHTRYEYLEIEFYTKTFLGCEKRRKIRLRSINPLQTK